MPEATNAVSITVDSYIIETTVGPDTTFKGDIKTSKPIQIEGYYEGDIDSDSVVIVAEIGSFKGSIKCSELRLIGKGEGKVQCSKLMEFATTGVFTGDVETKDLIIREGSLLDGTCKMSSMRNK